MGTFAQPACYRTSHLDAAAHGHKVHVVAGPFKKDIPDVSPDNITLAMQLIGNAAHQFHDGQVNVLLYFLTVNFHELRFFRLQKYCFFGSILAHVYKNH
jgi:hypothetical protein